MAITKRPLQAVIDHVNAAGATRHGHQSLHRWAARQPELAGFVTAAQVATAIREAAPSTQDRLLLALLRVAHEDELAQMTVVAGLSRRLGHHVASWARAGVGEGEGESLEAELVAECWLAVAQVARELSGGGDPPGRPGVAIPERARHAVRSPRRRILRADRRTAPLAAAIALPAAALGTPAEALAGEIVGAVRAGKVTPAAARIVFSTRVAGWSVAETARSLGATPETVRALRSRAERRLTAA